MINLIIKDLRLSRNVNIFAVIYVLFLAAMGLTQPISVAVHVLYIMSICMITFAVIIYDNGYDGRNSTEAILNSLPIDRVDIVKSKYASSLIFAVFNGIIMYIFTNLIKLFVAGVQGEPMALWDISISIIIILMFYSLYYPFYFKMGEGMRTFNMILWVFIFILPSIVTKLGKKFQGTAILKNISEIDPNEGMFIFLAVSVIVYIISLTISKKLYLKREF